MLEFLKCHFKTGGRTTVTALLTASFGYVALFPEDFNKFPMLVHMAKYVALGGFAIFGIQTPDLKTNQCEVKGEQTK